MPDEKKVSEEELVNTYQKHFDKNLALKLLKKLRKSTRDKPKVMAGTSGVNCFRHWIILQCRCI